MGDLSGAREPAGAVWGHPDPRAVVRSAASRLRDVADDLEASAGALPPRPPGDPTARHIVADAATHLRLTAEALEYAVG